jgi:Uma2 family endonuclease
MEEAWGMGDAALKIRMSPGEYLAFERASEERHEYADGEIFAMSGGTIQHAAIAGNIIRDLGIALRGRGCRVLTSDMRIHIPATGRYVYPDAAVVCGQAKLQDEHSDTLLNPRLIVEVLSDSSEAYDRGDKFDQYRTIESLRTYVIASQKGPRIEVFSRQSGDSWLLRVYGPGQRAALQDLEVFLDVDLVYKDALEPPASPAA